MERITYRKTLDVHKNGIQFLLQGFETADKMSRVIEVSLMASGDTIDFPKERVVAMMYVTSPGVTEPSINKCTIVDNKVVYEVLPITTEGITEMQIKLIETSPEGAKSVLASPKFALEVVKSNTEDEDVEKRPEFTALEEATARAKLVYDERFIRMEIAEDGTFSAYYADGTTYETDVIARMLVAASTELDLSALVKNGLTSFTADEVATEIKADLDAEYKDFFAKAVYSADLMGNYPEARFVHWDERTIATPLKALLTTKTKGFALVMGDGKTNHTVLAWCVGEKARTFYSRFIVEGTDTGWKDGNKEVIPIENGGTGASSAKEARKNLDVPSTKDLEDAKTYRIPWNLDENVGTILANAPSAGLVVASTNKKTEPSESFSSFRAINSGNIILSFKTRIADSGWTNNPCLKIFKNEEEIYVKTDIETLDGGTFKLPITVEHNDVIKFYAYAETGKDGEYGQLSVRDFTILANIDTPYKYINLSGSDNITIDDVVNALIGDGVNV